MMKSLPIWFQRVENLVLAIAIAFAFVKLDFDWWWLFVLFLVFDLSAAGYLWNKTVGAVTYNFGHSYIGPSLLMAIFVVTDNRICAFVALLWGFHIAVDRALGYGLKTSEGFKYTHLGKIGPEK